MTKKELVAAIAEKAEIKKVEAEKALNGIVEAITEELVAGGDITLTGFGKFLVKERAARTGRNPQTGETMSIPASKAPAFRAGKALKDAVKNA